MLLQGVGFEAVRHRVEVIVAYAADEAFGLEDKGGAKVEQAEQKNTSRHLGSCVSLSMTKGHRGGLSVTSVSPWPRVSAAAYRTQVPAASSRCREGGGR